MTTPPLRVERRVGQRFPYLLPISFRQPENGVEGVGFTQDLSSRGVFFLTDASLLEGSEIELTVRMPSEITLGETMPVRCKGRILRVQRPVSTSALATTVHSKIGVAVRFDCYEYLPQPVESPRMSALHPRHEDDQADTISMPSRAVG